ncbi:unnamed protein product [Phaeothamnion confervicola]
MLPATGFWKLGEVINYQLTGLVADEVKTVKYDATISHCRPNPCTGSVDCHTHTNGVNAGGTKFAGTVTPPGHAMPSSMTITATVTPANGTAFTVSEETTALQYAATVQAAVGGDVQPGWPIDVVDVTTCFSPCQVPYMAGISSELAAPQFMYRQGAVYAFDLWYSESKTFPTGKIPIVSDGMTLTANYTPMTASLSAAAPPALVGAAGFYGFIEVKWTAPVDPGYDIILINVIAADGTDRSAAALATDSRAAIGVPMGAATYSIQLAGYRSVTQSKSSLGNALSVSSSGDPSKTCYAKSAPYGGTAAVIPGTIQLERFDQGGEGTAYHDLTAGNTGGATFRKTLDVDITLPGVSQYAVTQADAGEWLEYTVSVIVTGSYSFTFYLASMSAGSKLVCVMSDATVCNPANALVSCTQVGDTSGAFVAFPAAAPVTLAAGEHTLTVCIDASGLQLDKIVIAAA